MGDLAQAIVDVARYAERRRIYRRTLRESAEVVVAALLPHLRTGDEVVLDPVVHPHVDLDAPSDLAMPLGPERGQDVMLAFRVEQLEWEVENKGLEIRPDPKYGPDGVIVPEPPLRHFVSPKKATGLVMYVLPHSQHEDRWRVEGSVLTDVRQPWTDDNGIKHPLYGREIWLSSHPDNGVDGADETDLHFATDDELVEFSDYAVAMAAEFASSLQLESLSFDFASKSLTKLAPK